MPPLNRQAAPTAKTAEAENITFSLKEISPLAAPNAIQVVVGCDDGYARHLSVMLLSLFEHSKTLPVKVHVLVSPKFLSRSRLDDALGSDAAHLSYYMLDAEDVPSPKERGDITSATYYRLLMGECLPLEIRRVIYLDCDMLICGDLADLWRASLDDAVVAAVSDPGFSSQCLLGLTNDAPYFNAGMMLIDLVRWRREAVGSSALHFRMTHPERVTYDDQCALNWILRGRWRELGAIWNVQALHLGQRADSGVQYFEPPVLVTSEARIVHFNAPGRPWLYMDDHPFKQVYLSYNARTSWRNERPADRYPHNVIIKILRRYAPVLLPIYQWTRKFI